MSLLRDALRATKDKETGSSAKPAVFHGPVIDADDILGVSGTITNSSVSVEESSALEKAGAGGETQDSSSLAQYAGSPTSDNAPLPDTAELSLQPDEGPIASPQMQQPPDLSAASMDSDDTVQQLSAPISDINPSISETSVQQPSVPETSVPAPSEYQAREYQTREQQIPQQYGSPHSAIDTGVQSAREPESIGSENTVGTALAARSINLDPLFFIIIAFAFAALFGSLYALVTQNDEFVNREYSQLRARQSALDELIAAQPQRNNTSQAIEDPTSLAVTEPVVGLVQSVETNVNTDEAAEPDRGDRAGEVTSALTVGRNASELEAATVDSGVADSIVSNRANLPASATAQQASEVVDAGEQKIAMLQGELNELRQSLASQNLRLSRFIEENSRLRQAAVSSSQSEAGSDVVINDRYAESMATEARSASYDKAGDITAVEEITTEFAGDLDPVKKPSRSFGKAAQHSQSQDRPRQIQGYRFKGATDARGAESKPHNQTSNQTSNQAGNQTVNPLSAGRVEKNDSSDGFSAVVGQAFHAYSVGNLKLAETLYARALQLQPYNRDANLGVAAVAVKTANYSVAIQRYRHLLSLQPDDVVAFSAMLNLAAVTSDAAVENEMLVHAQQHRQIPSLYAALGNYYSQTARWGRASQSYATAVGLAPDTADYLYNLAVSLDNLGDSEAAIETYNRALSLSEVGNYTFSVIEASARLRALQSN